MSEPNESSSLDPADSRHPVEQLADEFAARRRAGEHPTIESYAQQYPEHAALIRAMFPTVDKLEAARQQAEQQRERSSNFSTPPTTEQIPDQLGDFQLIRELGRGGMGVVFEAEQQSLKRRVALKVMAASPDTSPQRLERFRREAEAAATLHHTNVVAIFGTGEAQGWMFYAMQLIDGHSLSQLIQQLRSGDTRELPAPLATQFRPTNDSRAQTSVETRDDDEADASDFHGFTTDNAASPNSISNTTDASSPTPLPADDMPADDLPEDDSPAKLPLRPKYFRWVASLMADAASGLQHAHHHGILHRDIKPSNLMLDREGTIWITDFGVAKRSHLEDVTRSGELVGTLRYMAPEQLRGGGDARSDVYALGLVLYELLTLQPAVQSTSDQWLTTVGKRGVTPPSKLIPNLPQDLEVIVMKALAVDPPDRYASAAALADDLRRFQEDRPILARRELPWQRLRRIVRRNPALAATTFAIMTLLLVMAGMLGWFNRQQSRTLADLQREYTRAEENLRDKTRALKTADRERNRAAANLSMTLEAFAEVIENIGSRGGTDAVLEALQEDESWIDAPETTLSEADIGLLESLLAFFDRFAQTNAADLSAEVAAARERIGDIQQRLGRLDDAARSYDQALENYQQLDVDPNTPADHLLSQIGVLHKQMIVAGQRGRRGQMVRLYNEIQSRFAKAPEVRDTATGRLLMANVCNTLSAQATSLALRPRMRAIARGGLSGPAPEEVAPAPKEPGPGSEESSDVSVRQQRLQRESAANQLALALLESLLAENPDQISYRLTLAQTQRERARIAAANGNRDVAEQALNEAVRTLEQLSEAFPDSRAFRYELADTLRMSLLITRGETTRKALTRALSLSNTLVREAPESLEYRSLRSSISNATAIHAFQSRRPEAGLEALQQSLDDQRVLAGRRPDAVVYQVVVARTVLRLLDAYAITGSRDKALAIVDDVLDTLRQYQRDTPNALLSRQRLRPLIERLESSRERLMESEIVEGAPPR